MDAFDEMIRSEVQRVVGNVQPPQDLWYRIHQGLTHRRPPVASGLTTAAAVAAVILTSIMVALPGPRALATGWVRRVFKLGEFTYTLTEGQPITVRAPFAAELREGTEVEVTAANPNPVQQFTAEPGRFPDEARIAMQKLAHPFRVPRWLPANLPVRVAITEGADGNGDEIVHIVLGNDRGEAIFISQLAPAPDAIDLPTRSGSSAAEETLLGEIRALRLEKPDGVAYYFNVSNVQVTVSGPRQREDVIRRLAESLVR